jgi:hypothetical protein
LLFKEARWQTQSKKKRKKRKGNENKASSTPFRSFHSFSPAQSPLSLSLSELLDGNNFSPTFAGQICPRALDPRYRNFSPTFAWSSVTLCIRFPRSCDWCLP